ncbi:hypothetical protein CDD80_2257 [Ophiocordyceps camponoti-rufipedis]|uniref:Uncharacterized protein n=1 Tax=Ophiocordyceps camponoti-rufipedis TaxID=2004952 RepID=A0A2C5XSP8_9HYPO|nr:hypothetical protein CDD80_2257 [Ophiocordyceps camponoti-rufipedis]
MPPQPTPTPPNPALLETLLFLLPLLHLLLTPYTKVEESFALQATHDMLVYGTPLSAPRLTATYDHFAFPGAVPRTFVGPVLLAGLAQPILSVVGFRHAQFVDAPQHVCLWLEYVPNQLPIKSIS